NPADAGFLFCKSTKLYSSPGACQRKSIGVVVACADTIFLQYLAVAEAWAELLASQFTQQRIHDPGRCLGAAGQFAHVSRLSIATYREFHVHVSPVLQGGTLRDAQRFAAVGTYDEG